MPSPSWYFTKRRAIDRIRDPIAGEFFANETINRPGEALVREGIQNALDARRNNETVRVRLFVSGSLEEISASDLTSSLDGAWPHLEAKGNGLRDTPKRTDNCPYLVFEDFGTIGLEGDVAQTIDPPPGLRNPFFFFVRAEGRSDKSEKDRGRWGVGKQVFPMASRINSTFAVTVRSSDAKRFLIGQAVLKTHQINGASYTPDGWFGIEPRNDLPVMPVEDQVLIKKFSTLFKLHRGDEPGLSIVVPWYYLDITHNELLLAVIRHYFYPIITGDLEVSIETPRYSHKVTSTTLESVVEEVDGSFKQEVQPLIGLAQWAHKCDKTRLPKLMFPAREIAPAWSKELFAENILKSLQDFYEHGKPFAVRVPMYVYANDGTSSESYFTVFAVRDKHSVDQKPVFIREGIMISDARAPRCGGVRSLVVVEDKSLATMLGDAENPSHTRWEPGSHFKGKYRCGRQSLEYVTRSVFEIIRVLTEAEKSEDRTLLVDLFSLPAEGDPTQQPEQLPDSGTEPPEPPEPPTPTEQVLRISRTKGGFAIVPGKAPAKLFSIFEVRVAYDTRRGNPLKKYRSEDFALESAPVEVQSQGLELKHCAGNCITARINDATFRLSVSGFDPNRDLYVKVVPEVVADGD